mmetsp:Transcript_20527/g.33441  ORF Transcript_20527/g.33441 Transcript_20527/m.33441 type:complete len:369 (+) Transcript_20527:1210-2316(+)
MEQWADFAAVEPGSGTTIMSYNGICSHDNVVPSTAQGDGRNFHPINLVQMTGFVEWASRQPNCGQRQILRSSRPTVDVDDSCQLPIMTPFQLKVGNVKDMYLQIDTIDVHNNSYANRSIPRFRSFEPTRRAYRDFPSMYYLVNSMEDEIFGEILPSTPTTMNFRALVRTMFHRGQTDEDNNQSIGFGAFGYSDIEVDFVGNMGPFKISSTHQTLFAGEYLTVDWNVGNTSDASPTVEIMLAVHNMPRVSVHDFNYRTHVKELNWTRIAVVNNTGSAEIRVPPLFGTSGNHTVHMMIRSMGQGTCRFFALSPMLEFVDNSWAPTSSPTVLPTNAPLEAKPKLSDGSTLMPGCLVATVMITCGLAGWKAS